MFIPLQYAVIVGVAMSLLLFVIQQSNKITVKEWTPTENILPRETEASQIVEADRPTLLVTYGSLFFATAPLFEEQLPDVTEETHNAAVIINLRSSIDLGSTFLKVLERYVTDLHAQDSILMLAGVLPKIVDQLEKTGLIRLIGRDNIFVQGEIIGQSVLAAWDKAEQWIADEPLRRAAQMAAAESEVQEEETAVYLEDKMGEQLSKLIRKDEKTTRAGDKDV
jgi:SulP family sulfate permease